MMGDADEGGGGVALLDDIVGDVGEWWRGRVEASASRGVCTGRMIGLAEDGGR